MTKKMDVKPRYPHLSRDFARCFFFLSPILLWHIQENQLIYIYIYEAITWHWQRSNSTTVMIKYVSRLTSRATKLWMNFTDIRRSRAHVPNAWTPIPRTNGSEEDYPGQKWPNYAICITKIITNIIRKYESLGYSSIKNPVAVDTTCQSRQGIKQTSFFC